MNVPERIHVQFSRFITVGVFNTALGLAVIFAAKALLDWSDLSANATGYAVGLLASFVLNRHWTFRDRGDAGVALLRFIAAFGVAYSANLATVFGLRDLAGINAYLAQAAGIVPYTALFFLASRRFVFREQRRASAASPVDRSVG